MATAVFPGSFDPFTLGHHSIINRGLNLFDEIIIGIGINSEKKYLFPLEQRKKWIEQIFSKEKKVKIETYTGLTVDFCNKMNASFILRGIRSNLDLELEKALAQSNQSLNTNIETVCLLTEPKYSHIHSTIVRNIYVNKGNIQLFVPEIIYNDLYK
jgi:pantetheine-phosphate adenylyltransferase